MVRAISIIPTEDSVIGSISQISSSCNFTGRICDQSTSTSSKLKGHEIFGEEEMDDKEELEREDDLLCEDKDPSISSAAELFWRITGKAETTNRTMDKRMEDISEVFFDILVLPFWPFDLVRVAGIVALWVILFICSYKFYISAIFAIFLEVIPTLIVSIQASKKGNHAKKKFRIFILYRPLFALSPVILINILIHFFVFVL